MLSAIMNLYVQVTHAIGAYSVRSRNTQSPTPKSSATPTNTTEKPFCACATSQTSQNLRKKYLFKNSMRRRFRSEASRPFRSEAVCAVRLKCLFFYLLRKFRFRSDTSVLRQCAHCLRGQIRCFFFSLFLHIYGIH